MSSISTGWRTPYYMVCFFQDSIRWWSRSSMRTQIAERKHIYVGTYTTCRWVMHVVFKRHLSRIIVNNAYLDTFGYILDMFGYMLQQTGRHQMMWMCNIKPSMHIHGTFEFISLPDPDLGLFNRAVLEWALFFNDDDETLYAFANFVVLIAGTCPGYRLRTWECLDWPFFFIWHRRFNASFSGGPPWPLQQNKVRWYGFGEKQIRNALIFSSGCRSPVHPASYKFLWCLVDSRGEVGQVANIRTLGLSNDLWELINW